MRAADQRELVVVGASLAGLRAAQALRERGFTGALTLVGDEPHPPYDRPPLSKRVLTAPAGLPAPNCPCRTACGRAGGSAGQPSGWTSRQGPSPSRTAHGCPTTVWSSRPDRLPAAGRPGSPRRRPGVVTLRGWDDALALRAALTAGGPLVVVGAGFLGGEIAAAARERGLDVTLVEAASQPLEGALGTVAGAYVAALHREAGIVLRTGTTVEGFVTGADGRLAGVRLGDGTTVAAGTAVLAWGGVPSTGWLAGSGLALDGGVHCDPLLRVLRTDGSAVPDVVAAGDVARVPQPLAGGERLALGHWTNAVEQGTAAAATLLAGQAPDGTPAPFAAVPSFWSDLHGARIRSLGGPARRRRRDAGRGARSDGPPAGDRVPPCGPAGRRTDHRADRAAGLLPPRTGGAPGLRAGTGRTGPRVTDRRS